MHNNYSQTIIRIIKLLFQINAELRIFYFTQSIVFNKGPEIGKLRFLLDEAIPNTAE